MEALNQTDFYRLAEIVNEMKDKDILDRLRYYCREFLGDIEETGIEICRQWLKNNLSPNDMFLGGTYITKYRYDEPDHALHPAGSRNPRRTAQRRASGRPGPSHQHPALRLMVAWCMTDGQVKGSEKTDALCSIVLQAALAPYRQAKPYRQGDT